MNILLFTSAYPYGGDSEIFLKNELSIGSKLANITILPLRRNGTGRSIPSGVSVNNACNNQSKLFYIIIFIKMFFSSYFFVSIFFKEFLNAKKIFQKYYFIKNLYGAFIIKDIIKNRKVDYCPETIFYSYWMTYAPLALALLKDQGILKNKVVSRGHSYDIDEDEVGFHFPLRNLTYKYINCIFPISKQASETIKRRYPITLNKLKIERLGVLPIKNSHNRLETNFIRVISCSCVRPEKRVPLIFSSLNEFCKQNPNIRIQWDHIGGSSGFKDLNNLTKITEENFTVNLLGMLDYDEICNYYKSNDLNIFINLSIREGVPVAIMEALSASIPVLATNVGATSEIVTSKTGIMIDVDFNQKEFDVAVNFIINNYEVLSKSVYPYYLKYYSNNNYMRFYKNLI